MYENDAEPDSNSASNCHYMQSEKTTDNSAVPMTVGGTNFYLANDCKKLFRVYFLRYNNNIELGSVP